MAAGRKVDQGKMATADGGLFEMESGEENDEEDDNDKRGFGDKAKKRKASRLEREPEERKERYVLGMKAETKADGVFGDPYKVGKFVEEKVGKVKSVRITNGGIVIIECRDVDQLYRALNITRFGDITVDTFILGNEGSSRRKGVISGVPLNVKPDIFEDVEGVWIARRMTRYREGQREDTKSICLTFNGEIPERIYVDYMTYRVRPYERGPIRCYCCQDYGHVASVCRRARKCGRCGKEGCSDECKAEVPKCLHCSGSHYVGSADCPKRREEAKVNRIRVEKSLICGGCEIE